MSIKNTLAFAVSSLALFSSFSANASISLVSSSPITGPTYIQAGYPSVMGAYAAFTNPLNLALNATVTVSGTIPGFSSIHNAANLTDGNYGNGSSWIGEGSNSWLTINLDSIKFFDTISFGRDRLGSYSDRGPGQFTISISNDNSFFTQIFDSTTFGFSGAVGAGQTIQTNLSIYSAQFIRLQFANAGAAIDEVEIKNTSPVPLPATFWLFWPTLAWFELTKRSPRRGGTGCSTRP